jgi:hypothetical protein
MSAKTTKELLDASGYKYKAEDLKPKERTHTPTLRHKHDVILDFHSSPDAILNALHQAGWAITPKADIERITAERDDARGAYKAEIRSHANTEALRRKVTAERDKARDDAEFDAAMRARGT